ncbi:unnamed protein product [Amoebophrya sp. A25]|nr:unnamed protein product [Amoebophrya sp. A25]|eukprot:GSA25T00026708001.1
MGCSNSKAAERRRLRAAADGTPNSPCHKSGGGSSPGGASPTSLKGLFGGNGDVGAYLQWLIDLNGDVAAVDGEKKETKCRDGRPMVQVPWDAMVAVVYSQLALLLDFRSRYLGWIFAELCGLKTSKNDQKDDLSTNELFTQGNKSCDSLINKLATLLARNCIQQAQTVQDQDHNHKRNITSGTDNQNDSSATFADEQNGSTLASAIVRNKGTSKSSQAETLEERGLSPGDVSIFDVDETIHTTGANLSKGSRLSVSPEERFLGRLFTATSTALNSAAENNNFSVVDSPLYYHDSSSPVVASESGALEHGISLSLLQQMTDKLEAAPRWQGLWHDCWREVCFKQTPSSMQRLLLLQQRLLLLAQAVVRLREILRTTSSTSASDSNIVPSDGHGVAGSNYPAASEGTSALARRVLGLDIATASKGTTTGGDVSSYNRVVENSTSGGNVKLQGNMEVESTTREDLYCGWRVVRIFTEEEWKAAKAAARCAFFTGKLIFLVEHLGRRYSVTAGSTVSEVEVAGVLQPASIGDVNGPQPQQIMTVTPKRVYLRFFSSPTTGQSSSGAAGDDSKTNVGASSPAKPIECELSFEPFQKRNELEHIKGIEMDKADEEVQVLYSSSTSSSTGRKWLGAHGCVQAGCNVDSCRSSESSRSRSIEDTLFSAFDEGNSNTRILRTDESTTSTTTSETTHAVVELHLPITAGACGVTMLSDRAERKKERSWSASPENFPTQHPENLVGHFLTNASLKGLMKELAWRKTKKAPSRLRYPTSDALRQLLRKHDLPLRAMPLVLLLLLPPSGLLQMMRQSGNDSGPARFACLNPTAGCCTTSPWLAVVAADFVASTVKHLLRMSEPGEGLDSSIPQSRKKNTANFSSTRKTSRPTATKYDRLLQYLAPLFWGAECGGETETSAEVLPSSSSSRQRDRTATGMNVTVPQAQAEESSGGGTSKRSGDIGASPGIESATSSSPGQLSPSPLEISPTASKVLNFACILRVTSCLLEYGLACWPQTEDVLVGTTGENLKGANSGGRSPSSASQTRSGEARTQALFSSIQSSASFILAQVFAIVRREPLILCRALSYHIGGQFGSLDSVRSVLVPDLGVLLPSNSMNFQRIWRPLDEAGLERLIVRQDSAVVVVEKGKNSTTIVEQEHPEHVSAARELFARLLSESLKIAASASQEYYNNDHSMLAIFSRGAVSLGQSMRGEFVMGRVKCILRVVLRTLIEHEEKFLNEKLEVSTNAVVVPPQLSIPSHAADISAEAYRRLVCALDNPSADEVKAAVQLASTRPSSPKRTGDDSSPMAGLSAPAVSVPALPQTFAAGSSGPSSTGAPATTTTASSGGNVYMRLGKLLQEVPALLSQLSFVPPEILVAHWALRGFLYERQGEVDISNIDYQQAYQILEDLYGDARVKRTKTATTSTTMAGGVVETAQEHREAKAGGDVRTGRSSMSSSPERGVQLEIRESSSPSLSNRNSLHPGGRSSGGFGHPFGVFLAWRLQQIAHLKGDVKGIDKFGDVYRALRRHWPSTGFGCGPPFAAAQSQPPRSSLEPPEIARLLFVSDAHWIEHRPAIPEPCPPSTAQTRTAQTDSDHSQLQQLRSRLFSVWLHEQESLIKGDSSQLRFTKNVAPQMRNRFGSSPSDADHYATGGQEIRRGSVLVFGSNAHGQLGLGHFRRTSSAAGHNVGEDVEWTSRPIRLMALMEERIVDVSTGLGSHTIVRTAEKNELWGWGHRTMPDDQSRGKKDEEKHDPMKGASSSSTNSSTSTMQMNPIATRLRKFSVEGSSSTRPLPSTASSTGGARRFQHESTCKTGDYTLDEVFDPGKCSFCSSTTSSGDEEDDDDDDDDAVTAAPAQKAESQGSSRQHLNVRPIRLPWDPRMPVDKIACGVHFTVVLSSGSVFVQGLFDEDGNWSGADGIFGTSDTRSAIADRRSRFRRVIEFGMASSTVKEVSDMGNADEGQKPGEEDLKNLWSKDSKNINIRIADVACGSFHVCALDTLGRAFSWGRGEGGQLGIELARLEPAFEAAGDTLVQSPLLVDTFGTTNNAPALQEQGGKSPSTWSQTSSAMLPPGEGNANTTSASGQASPPAFLVQVSCGEVHTCALDSKGVVWSWGWGEFGQLGLGSAGRESRQWTPQAVATKHFDGKRIRQISCGGAFSIAITDVETEESYSETQSSPQLKAGGTIFGSAYAGGGKVYAWGTNDQGQCGMPPVAGRTMEILAPRQVLALAHTRIVQVSCGLQHVLAVDSQGRVFSWGSGGHGQLGTRSLPRVRQPPPATSAASSITDTPQMLQCVGRVRITKVAAGREHSALVT